MKLLRNILLAYASYFACRIVFVWHNWESVSIGLEGLDWWRVLRGILLFDDSTFCYTLGIYLLMMLLPLPVRYNDRYQSICKWYFVIINAICIVMNLADSVYFPWSGKRSTVVTLKEFNHEGICNILEIIGIEIIHNWWMILLAAGLVAAIWLLYKKESGWKCWKSPLRWILAVLIWVAIIPLCIGGMRGGFTRKTRPIGIGYSMRYVNTPAQAAAILNTPFTMIRNISGHNYKTTTYMPMEEVPKHYTALHKAQESRFATKPNVFVIIVESLSEEFMGAYNSYPGYTPFLDSLHSVSLSPKEAFANGNKSIDALPSILASVPRVEEHLFVTPYINDKYSSLFTELGAQGYTSAFFHGGADGSMGFDAFAFSAGVEKTYSLEEYCDDPRFGGRKDFDGLWAIWDEEFLQFTALKTSRMKEPFVNAVFTASSHHPFVIPHKYMDKFTYTEDPMYNCISYTDYSLKRFFQTASEQAWFKNTVFVITADHTSTVRKHEKYLDDPIGDYRIPLFIFDPSGTLPRGTIDVISQQSDIFPTVMGIVGADTDYIAFGKDIINEKNVNWAYFYNELHTLKTSDGLFSFDGEKITMSVGEFSDTDLDFLKAFIQDYKYRIINDKLKSY